MKRGKCLIVGKGLAGTMVACRLEESGIPFRIVDDPGLSSSSRIAGGLLNPVVFKRLTVSEKGREFLKTAEVFYTALEKKLQTDFYSAMPVVKLFGDREDVKSWESKSKGELSDMIDSSIVAKDYHAAVPSPNGFSRVKGSAVLNIQKFLTALAERWKSKECLEEAAFNYSDLQIEKGIRWKGEEFSCVIFCEGYKVVDNPWFSVVGLSPVKGEILTVSIPGLGLKEILNKGVYIIPLGDDLYKVGATYSWEKLNDEPTPSGKEELEEKLRALVKLPYKVLDHQAGVRPATIGRRAVVGEHPQHKGMFILNGLGTKGTLIGPYYSQMLLNCIQGTGLPEAEADVKRFF